MTQLNDSTLLKSGSYINGQWLTNTKQLTSVSNPATGKEITQ